MTSEIDIFPENFNKFLNLFFLTMNMILNNIIIKIYSVTSAEHLVRIKFTIVIIVKLTY